MNVHSTIRHQEIVIERLRRQMREWRREYHELERMVGKRDKLQRDINRLESKLYGWRAYYDKYE